MNRARYTVPLFSIATLLMMLSVLGKNSKPYNQAFNGCTQKMEAAYADCLNQPYNSVAMCQNVASGVYKRCMRSKGFYVRETPTVGTGPNGKPQTQGGSSPSPTPKKIRPVDTSVMSTTTIAKSSPSATPRPSASPKQKNHKQ